MTRLQNEGDWSGFGIWHALFGSTVRCFGYYFKMLKYLAQKLNRQLAPAQFAFWYLLCDCHNAIQNLNGDNRDQCGHFFSSPKTNWSCNEEKKRKLGHNDDSYVQIHEWYTLFINNLFHLASQWSLQQHFHLFCYLPVWIHFFN